MTDRPEFDEAFRALLAKPRATILLSAFEERGEPKSLARDALMAQSGTFGHLRRLCELDMVFRIALVGTHHDDRISIETVAPVARACGAGEARHLGSDLIRHCLEKLEDPEIGVFDEMRRSGTAGEMKRLSLRAGLGAAIQAFLEIGSKSDRPDGLDPSVVQKAHARYSGLKPDMRAMVLVAVEGDMSAEQIEREQRLSHKELAWIFGIHEDNVKKLSKKIRSVKDKLA